MFSSTARRPLRISRPNRLALQLLEPLLRPGLRLRRLRLGRPGSLDADVEILYPHDLVDVLFGVVTEGGLPMHPHDGNLDHAQTPLAGLIIGLERPVFVVADRLREVVALRSERLITVNRVREGGPRDRSDRGEKEQSEERSELLHCFLSARPRRYSNTASACARKSALLRTCTGGTANWSVSHRQNDSTRSRSMAAHSRRAPGARY